MSFVGQDPLCITSRPRILHELGLTTEVCIVVLDLATFDDLVRSILTFDFTCSLSVLRFRTFSQKVKSQTSWTPQAATDLQNCFLRNETPL
jgi:hypothetical protein